MNSFYKYARGKRGRAVAVTWPSSDSQAHVIVNPIQDLLADFERRLRQQLGSRFWLPNGTRLLVTASQLDLDISGNRESANVDALSVRLPYSLTGTALANAIRHDPDTLLAESIRHLRQPVTERRRLTHAAATLRQFLLRLS